MEVSGLIILGGDGDDQITDVDGIDNFEAGTGADVVNLSSSMCLPLNLLLEIHPQMTLSRLKV